MKLAKKAASIFLMSVWGVGWSQTPPPVRQVSGVGAQASAHTGPVALSWIAATAMDVLVAFNANDNVAGSHPTIAVFVTLTTPSGQKVLFSSTSSAAVSYWIGSNGSLNVKSNVAALEQNAIGSTSGLNVDLNLTWSTTNASEKVTAHDSYNQPGYSMTQSLSGDLQQTTVSGSVTVNGIPAPLAGMPSYWSTNNSQTDTAGEPTTFTSSSGCSGTGYWTGYWTWITTTKTWYWTWVWVWCAGSYTAS